MKRKRFIMDAFSTESRSNDVDSDDDWNSSILKNVSDSTGDIDYNETACGMQHLSSFNQLESFPSLTAFNPAPPLNFQFKFSWRLNK